MNSNEVVNEMYVLRIIGEIVETETISFHCRKGFGQSEKSFQMFGEIYENVR